MRGRGIGVGIGSDGVICNNTMDLFEELRVAALFDRARIGSDEAASSASELLRSLTIDGARVLGLENETGSIETGKSADLCAVDLSGSHIEPVHDIETAIIWSASATDIAMTMVEGEVLWQNDQLTRWDVDELRAAVREVPGVLSGEVSS
jgi:5-methylthioadenosine/S-adenosylhomocysteine deaminase